MNSENRKLFELQIKQAAKGVYDSLNASERRGVQFGLHPAEKMQKAQAALIANYIQAEGHAPDPSVMRDIARLLAVGVMDCANAGSDKMIV